MSDGLELQTFRLEDESGVDEQTGLEGISFGFDQFESLSTDVDESYLDIGTDIEQVGCNVQLVCSLDSVVTRRHYR